MILVIGEILFDLFPDYRRIGGAPFNFAFHLKQLGFDVAFVSRVGKDALGDEILAFIREKGLNPDHIQVDPAHATGTVDIFVDTTGNHTFSILPDRAYDHIQWDSTLEQHCASAPAMVYFGTLTQRTPKGAGLMNQVLSSLDPNTLRFCDINLRPSCWTRKIVDRSVRRSDILKLSSEELDILVPGKETNQIARAAGMLSSDGPSLVILTRGEKGSIWVTARGAAEYPVPGAQSIDVADTVGAGDAYAAMAAAGRLAGLPDEQTADLAQEFAGFICTAEGALPEDTTIYHTYKKRLHDH